MSGQPGLMASVDEAGMGQGMAACSARDIAARLRQQLECWEGERRAVAARRWGWPGGPVGEGSHKEAISTGVVAWDEVLPWGGIRRGSVVEFLGDRGSGAGTLALLIARQALRTVGGAFVIVERRRRFYPPAAARWQIPLQKCLWVEASDARLAAWAVDQSLRCPAVAAVWVPGERFEALWYRRWQLAAEETGTVGLVVRPAAAVCQPSWADVRLVVRTHVGGTFAQTAAVGSQQGRSPRRLIGVEVIRCRHGPAHRSVVLWLDDQTGEVGDCQQEASGDEASGVSMATALAHPATLCSAARLARKAAGLARS